MVVLAMYLDSLSWELQVYGASFFIFVGSVMKNLLFGILLFRVIYLKMIYLMLTTDFFNLFRQP